MLHMYILSSVLGVSMSTFSYLFLPLSEDVERAETRQNIRLYILTLI